MACTPPAAVAVVETATGPPLKLLGQPVQINHPEPTTKTVYDYDFAFDNGNGQSITIDPTLGDTIDFTDKTIEVVFAPKPSKTNPTVTLNREEVTFYLPKIVYIQKRERQLTDLSAEQKLLWEKELKKHIN